jgi:ribosomal protein S18 acetylase RimI-like enzyme
VVEETVDASPEYGDVPISFVVRSRMRVEPVDGGLGGLALVEGPVDPYVKDSDAERVEGPTCWPKRFDVSSWGVLSAFEGERRVGGAVVAWNTPWAHPLRGRDDLAALWDLRVRPEHRGRGVGTTLFDRAIVWAQERGCHLFEVETQNTNVAACRFYARRGCVLGAIDRHAYADAPDEVRLLWYVDLRGGARNRSGGGRSVGFTDALGGL